MECSNLFIQFVLLLLLLKERNVKRYTGVAISTGTEFQMVVAQKWLKPGPWEFLELFIMKFRTYFENLTVVAKIGVDS